MRIFAKSILLASAITLAFPIMAQAQFTRDNSAPIDATADDIINSRGTTILTGQVDVRQGTTRILADKMQIFSGGAGAIGASSDISKIIATGNFYYLTPDQEVRGTKGVYTQIDDTIVVTGDVILLQNDNVVTGDKLVYNLTTEQANVVGTCKGRKCGKNGRVKILIKNTKSAEGAQ